ncbi:MAG: hypothetical protein ACR2J4_05605 [Deinococcus sp.]
MNTKLSLGTLALMLAPVLAQGMSSVTPPPSSIGSNISQAYQGPFPSSFKKEFVGPVLLLRAGKVSADGKSVKLPLYHGQMRDGRKVWYILTDTTDEANANALGLNHSAKLAYGNTGRSARPARLERDGTLTFMRGTVNFAPKHAITPGAAPNFFPPKSFQPGAVGDQYYSPLISITNAVGQIYNAPIVAFDVGADKLNHCGGGVDHAVVHDKVLKICPSDQTVTLALTPGFSFGKPVSYLSMDSNDPTVAALENVTLAPGLNDTLVGRDDGAFSAVERLFTVVNGPMGLQNPQRQGLNSALGDKAPDGPLNLLGGIPTVGLDYSPLWDVNVGEWTASAVSKGYRSRIIDEFQYLSMVQQGFITGPGGKKFGSSGVIVNCPIVMRLL